MPPRCRPLMLLLIFALTVAIFKLSSLWVFYETEVQMKAVKWALVALLTMLFLFPFYWTFVTAIKAKPELLTWPPTWWPADRALGQLHRRMERPTLRHLPVEFQRGHRAVDHRPTCCRPRSSPSALRGFPSPAATCCSWSCSAAMMIPWDVTMIPLYMEFNWLGWINTLKPLIVPAWFGAPFFIFLLRQFIMSIPRELDEAAKMDGANMFQIYWKVHLPLMAPALVLVGVFQVLAAWNDYLGPLIFLNDQSKYTLTLGLAQFKGLHRHRPDLSRRHDHHPGPAAAGAVPDRAALHHGQLALVGDQGVTLFDPQKVPFSTRESFHCISWLGDAFWLRNLRGGDEHTNLGRLLQIEVLEDDQPCAPHWTLTPDSLQASTPKGTLTLHLRQP